MEELIGWLIILGILGATIWLAVAAGRRLRAWLAQSRVRRQNQQAECLPQPPPGQLQISSSASTNVVLGPPRRVKLDRQVWIWIPKGPPLVIQPRPDPLWVEKGWRRKGNTFHGEFRANGRSWKGMIQEPYPGGWQAYIWNPPLRELEAKDHPHRPCFMDPYREGPGRVRYKVHFHTLPSSVDHAIANIEQILEEAVGNGRPRPRR